MVSPVDPLIKERKEAKRCKMNISARSFLASKLGDIYYRTKEEKAEG